MNIKDALCAIWNTQSQWLYSKIKCGPIVKWLLIFIKSHLTMNGDWQDKEHKNYDKKSKLTPELLTVVVGTLEHSVWTLTTDWPLHFADTLPLWNLTAETPGSVETLQSSHYTLSNRQQKYVWICVRMHFNMVHKKRDN